MKKIGANIYTTEGFTDKDYEIMDSKTDKDFGDDKDYGWDDKEIGDDGYSDPDDETEDQILSSNYHYIETLRANNDRTYEEQIRYHFREQTPEEIQKMVDFYMIAWRRFNEVPDEFIV